MVITETTRAALESTLPSSAATIASARAYIAAASMTIPQFAKLVGRSTAGVNNFLTGRYLAYGVESDVLIRRDIEQAMALHPVGLANTAAAGRLYETENVRDMRRLFEHCHQHQALAFVYGPPGSQKTFVLEHLVAEFNRRELSRDDSRNRAYLVRASIEIRPRDLVAKICREVGAATALSLQGCMTGLRQQLRGTRTIIVLDEAQLCGIPALEALRELHDTDPRIGILLAGSHSLKQFFDTRAAELEQWNSRLHAGIELSGVSDACARAILSVECPELNPDLATEWIEASKVADIYSRDRKRRYLSVRRLFNSIADYNRLAAEAKEAASL